MTNLISRAIARISTLLEGLQVKQFFAAGLVGFLLLTTNVDMGRTISRYLRSCAILLSKMVPIDPRPPDNGTAKPRK
jgi:hypothetical protein